MNRQLARDGLIGLGILALLAGMYCCDLNVNAGEVKPRYECVLPVGPTISGIKPGYFRAVTMTDSEVAQQIAIDQANLKLEMDKALAKAELDKKQARLEAENKVRWAALCCMGLGFVLMIAGIACCIWADPKLGAKGIVAGAVIGGTFGAIAVYTQWFLCIFGGAALLGSVALGVWLWRSGRVKVALDKTIEAGELMKNVPDWQTNKDAQAAVRKIQLADPASKTRSWVEIYIAEARERYRQRMKKVNA